MVLVYVAPARQQVKPTLKPSSLIQQISQAQGGVNPKTPH
jgi:hypothetical protein